MLAMSAESVSSELEVLYRYLAAVDSYHELIEKPLSNLSSPLNNQVHLLVFPEDIESTASKILSQNRVKWLIFYNSFKKISEI